MSAHEPSRWRSDLQATTVAQTAAREGESDVRVPGLTVLAHPDVQRVGEQAHLTDLAAGRRTSLSRLQPPFAQPSGGPIRPLADPHLSRRAFELRPGAGEGAVQVSRRETPTLLQVDGVSVAESIECPPGALEEGVTLLLAERVALLLHRLDPVYPTAGPPYGLIGESEAMARLRSQIGQISELRFPVLIRGETGSGKELVATAIHQSSPRRAGPFVAVNMAAIPSSLAAAEIFGTVKGGFTGADKSRRGYFRQANSGTLFLDEIGETPREIQLSLLRALEEEAVHPVGADRQVPIDVRVVAATDADLEQAVAAGEFSAPLLHRLNGFAIRVPPLRQRRDDIGRLLVHFMAQELQACGMSHRLDPAVTGAQPWLPASLVARLAASDWPGNVRQLRNVARRLVAGHRHREAIGEDRELEELLSGSSRPRAAIAARPVTVRQRTEDISETDLRGALQRHGWRIQPTARHLGISRTTLYAMIERSASIHLASQLPEDQITAAIERHGGDLAAAAEALGVSVQGLRRRLRQMDAGT